MKKTVFVAALATVLGFGSAFANTTPLTDKPEYNLSEQIQAYLSTSEIYVKKQDLTAKVLFTLTSEKRIAVLDIHSDYNDVKGMISRTLKGKKVQIEDLEVGKKYIIDVRITS